MKKIYLKKLRRAFAFNIKGRCACGGKAEIMFYDEKVLPQQRSKKVD